jgi:hypothetical protein
MFFRGAEFSSALNLIWRPRGASEHQPFLKHPATVGLVPEVARIQFTPAQLNTSSPVDMMNMNMYEVVSKVERKLAFGNKLLGPVLFNCLLDLLDAVVNGLSIPKS